MIIAATADIHAPCMLKIFDDGVRKLENVDVFLLCGDLVDNNQHFYLKKIYNIIRDKFPDCLILSVFGNNEFYTYRDFYKKEYHYMNWIEEEIVEIGNIKFLGTEGVLDSIPNYIRKYLPNAREVFEKRLEKIEQLLKENNNIILFTHYSPTPKTVAGDPAPASILSSKKFEELIQRYSKHILYVFHGHAHNAKIWKTKIENTEVINVSLFIHKRIIVIEI